MYRTGYVVEIDEAACRARVQFPDADGVVSYPLPVLQAQTKDNRDYWLPDLGEYVAVVLDQYGESGVILGAIYNNNRKPEAGLTVDKRRARFADGTMIEYDRAAHKLTADVQGVVEVKATGTITADAGGNITAKTPAQIIADAPKTIVKGELEVEGLLTYKAGLKGSGGGAFSAEITGALKASTIDSETISLDTHVHGGVASGTQTTGTPQ